MNKKMCMVKTGSLGTPGTRNQGPILIYIWILGQILIGFFLRFKNPSNAPQKIDHSKVLCQKIPIIAKICKFWLKSSIFLDQNLILQQKSLHCVTFSPVGRFSNLNKIFHTKFDP